MGSSSWISRSRSESESFAGDGARLYDGEEGITHQPRGPGSGARRFERPSQVGLDPDLMCVLEGLVSLWRLHIFAESSGVVKVIVTRVERPPGIFASGSLPVYRARRKGHQSAAA